MNMTDETYLKLTEIAKMRLFYFKKENYVPNWVDDEDMICSGVNRVLKAVKKSGEALLSLYMGWGFRDELRRQVPHTGKLYPVMESLWDDDGKERTSDVKGVKAKIDGGRK